MLRRSSARSIRPLTLPPHAHYPSPPHAIRPHLIAGDYLSDALAAQVGGIGIAPGGNINYKTGHAIFEATHGTAPKYANLDMVVRRRRRTPSSTSQ